MKKLFLPVVAGLAVLSSAYVWPGDINLLYGSPTSVPFTPLHTFFMSPTGSDANNGLTTATAWASPNHAVSCGDVIIAQTGAYSRLASWGAVSSCPSTSGWIDGTGGVYFATVLCAGNVGACSITGSASLQAGIEVGSNNWAVEGWSVSEGYTGSRSGFGFASNTGSTQRHHVAFINNIAHFNAFGFSNSAAPVGGNGNGVDYWAIVGNIAQDSAGRTDGFYDAAIDVIGVKDWDTVAGTHILVDGNFSFNNQQTANAANCADTTCTDGESYMFDTLEALSYSQQIVAKNNIAVVSEKMNWNWFFQNGATNAIPIHVYNNTSYASNQYGFTTSGNGSASGDFRIQSTSSTLPWVIALHDNIALEDKTVVDSSTSGVYALQMGGNYAGPVIGGTGHENIFKGIRTSCNVATCDSGFNVVAFNGGSFGTNIYTDPLFNNTSDLLSNRIGTPSCSGFNTTTACMGWNFGSLTATNPSLIYDLTATAAAAAGKGYQPPGACAADSDYPTWLKGIVYLQASGFTNGATLTENQGLINRPCNL